MTTAIIVAAGKSTRMGDGVDKSFLSLVNKPVVAWSLLAFERCPDIDSVVLVVRKTQVEPSKTVAKMFGLSKLKAIVPGGAKRRDSVAAGLAKCPPETRIAVVHDGARPLVSPDMVSQVVEAARKHGAATIGRRMIDTVKRAGKTGTVERTEDREKLWTVQTPQAFAFDALKAAIAAAAEAKREDTDECAAMEAAGATVKIVECNRQNFKITTVEDLQAAGALLK